MGYNGRKKKKLEPCPDSEPDHNYLTYFSEGNKRELKRDWLESHALKSEPRDWNPALWTYFEPPRLFSN
jgi:hypothetical protein